MTPETLRVRVYHAPQGEPCTHCGLPSSKHRREYRVGTGRGKPRQRYKHKQQEPLVLGTDGEGQGKKIHRYTFLAVSNKEGTYQRCVRNPNGLTAEQVLDFYLSLPRRAKIFSYSFNYDITKIIESLPNRKVYLLLRPEERFKISHDDYEPPAVQYNGYKLNFIGTKFTISRGNRRVTIWDVFKFYQSSFVKSIKDWKVGSPEQWERIQRMKLKRNEFDKESPENVERYCFEECQLLAELVIRLVEAHLKAGLHLRAFHGAGSTSSALLDKMGIREKTREAPKKMLQAVASAFIGGRFENRCTGIIQGKKYSKDISSAYPYQLYRLPCLEHGKWEHTYKRRQILSARAALVKWTIRENSKIKHWAPFPVRSPDGSIVYPKSAKSGWCWRDEYLAGEKLYPNDVSYTESWVLHSNCDCVPFKEVPRYYRERIKIGKEGPGIVLKLGLNGMYGKLAQSVGNPIFGCWIWSGMITSGTRAQILELMYLHKDLSNLIMIATDGIQTTEDVKSPVPINTGTFDTGKPLGGWEDKPIEKDMFYMRPGVYFPLQPSTEEIASLRARGIGRNTLHENWQRIIDTWSEHGFSKDIEVSNTRFLGAKSGTSRAGKPGAYEFRRSDKFGTWFKHTTNLSFDPRPKRKPTEEKGQVVDLPLWNLPYAESQPYEKAIMSQSAKQFEAHRQMLEEQPDYTELGDY